MKKPHLHKLPTYRHAITRQRAVIAPIWGTDTYTMDIYDYRQRYGRDAVLQRHGVQGVNYQIYIKYEDGTGSHLTYRDRSEWKLKTAKKHLRDVMAGIVAGRFKGARYAALVMA